MNEREKLERMKYQKGYNSNGVNYFYDNNYIDYVITDYNLFKKIRKFILNIFKKKG